MNVTSTSKALTQIRQICESAMKWDEDKCVPPTLSDRAWLAKCILDILKENSIA